MINLAYLSCWAAVLPCIYNSMPAALQIQAIAMLCQCDTQALLGVVARLCEI